MSINSSENLIKPSTDEKTRLSQKIICSCPSCAQIPFLTIEDFKKPDKIHIDCKCSHNETIPLKIYLDQLRSAQIPVSKCQKDFEHGERIASEYCLQCGQWLCNECLEAHNTWIRDHKTALGNINVNIKCAHGRVMDFYCYDCNEHLCYICWDEKHKDHKVIKLSEFLSNNKLKHIKDEFFHVQKNAIENNCKLKDTIVGLLHQQIEKIEKAYKENYEINNNIVTFFQLLINNSNLIGPNYFVLSNIKNNSHFNISQQSNISLTDFSSENIEKLVEYYDNNYIYGEKEKGIELASIERPIYIIREHKDWIKCLTQLKDGRLASASDDKKIKVFNKTTYKCEITINGHSDCVNYITQINTGELVSCSSDKTIKIWKISEKKSELVSTLKAHSDYVWKIIELSGGFLCSCSSDCSIMIWEKQNEYKMINKLLGHDWAVYSVIEMKSGKYLVSGSGDKTIRFWDAKTYEPKEKINDINCWYNSTIYEIENEKLILTDTEQVFIFNTVDFKVEAKIEDDNFGLVCCFLMLRDRSLICGCLQGKICQIDLGYCQCISTKTEVEGVGVGAMVGLGEKCFATGTGDGIIKIWNY